MARTKSASSRRPASSARRTISKPAARKHHVASVPAAAKHPNYISDSQARRLLARGLTPSVALDLIKILGCTIEELIAMYKCRKGLCTNAVLTAKRYMAKKAKKQVAPPPKKKPTSSGGKNKRPPKKVDDEVIYWIGDYCAVNNSAGMHAVVSDGQKVMVSNLADLAPNKEAMDAAVEVRDVYETRVAVGAVTDAVKYSVVGKLLTPFDAYYVPEGGGMPLLRTFHPGCKVRFYTHHVMAIVRADEEFVDSDIESHNDAE